MFNPMHLFFLTMHEKFKSTANAFGNPGRLSPENFYNHGSKTFQKNRRKELKRSRCRRH